VVYNEVHVLIFSGASEKLRKTPFKFMSVCPSALKKSTQTGQIFVKLHLGLLLRAMEKIFSNWTKVSHILGQ
jgi:hypothetical protein